MKQPTETPLENAVLIPRDRIRANPLQPRRIFTQAELDELADSIREYGILQPINVRYEPSKYDATPYIVVGGERRWRASEGILDVIPAIIRNVNKSQAQRLALVENLHRVDLTAIEEARGLADLMKLENLSANKAARELKKSPGWVNNRLALLKTGKDVQEVAAKMPAAMTSCLMVDGIKDKEVRANLLEEIESGAAHSVIKAKVENYKTFAVAKPRNAPDSHTQARLTAYESNGVPNMSRGVRVTGNSQKQNDADYEWGLKQAVAGINTMYKFENKASASQRKKLIPEIRKQIARLEKLAQ